MEAQTGDRRCGGGDRRKNHHLRRGNQFRRIFSTSCGKTSTDEVWNTAETAEYLKSVTVGGGEAGTGDGGGVCIVYHQKGQHKSGSGGRLVPLAGDDSGGCAVRTAADQKIGEITGIECGGGQREVRQKPSLSRGKKDSWKSREYQIRKFLSAKGWPIQKNDGTVSCEMELLPSACFIVVPEKEGETVVSFTFYGGGYSHGVGMSQNGAKTSGRAGKIV